MSSTEVLEALVGPLDGRLSQAVHIVEPGFQGDWEARTASPTPFPRRQLSPVPSPESTGHDVDQAVEASDDALVNITITAVVNPVGNGVAQDVGVPAPFSAAALANGRVTQQKSAEIYEVANSNILPTLRMEDAADTFAALSAPNGIDRLTAVVAPGRDTAGPAVLFLKSVIGDAHRGRSKGVMRTQELVWPGATQSKRYKHANAKRRGNVASSQQRQKSAQQAPLYTTKKPLLIPGKGYYRMSARESSRRATPGIEGRSSRLPQIPAVALMGLQPIYTSRTPASLLHTRKMQAERRSRAKELQDKELHKLRHDINSIKLALAKSLTIELSGSEKAAARWDFAGSEVRRKMREKKTMADVVISKMEEVKQLEKSFLRSVKKSTSMLQGSRPRNDNTKDGKSSTRLARKARAAVRALEFRRSLMDFPAHHEDDAEEELEEVEEVPREKVQLLSFKEKVARDRRRTEMEENAKQKLKVPSASDRRRQSMLLSGKFELPDASSDSEEEEVMEVVDYLKMTEVSLGGANRLYHHIWFNVCGHEEDETVNDKDFMVALHCVSSNKATDEELQFCKLALDIVDEANKSAATRDYDLFCTMAALSDRVRVQNRAGHIHHIDFSNTQLLRAKMVQSRALFYLCDGAQTDGLMSLQEFEHTCLAGHVDQRVILAILLKLEEEDKHHITFLDFLAFLPLFVNAHGTVLLNPLESPSEQLNASKRMSAHI